MQVADLNLIIDIISKIASVLVFLFGLLDWFIDYKINQKLNDIKPKITKKNRCSSRKGKQR